MRASELSKELSVEHDFTTGSDPEVLGVTNDSRRVSPGDLYAALPGEHTDGHRFIADAIAAGAVAILCGQAPREIHPSVSVFRATDLRLVLSEISHLVYGRPSEQLTIIGITGTDGKTTTASFTHQLLAGLGYRTGLISSALVDYGDGEEANPLHQSTPEAPEVHRVLRSMIERGVTHAVIESTSHGLSIKTCRLAHVHYNAAVLTNMSPEHLEFHGTFEQYRHDKANLFRALDYGCYANAGSIAESDSGRARPLPRSTGRPFAVVNADDPVANYFKESFRGRALQFSLSSATDYYPLAMESSASRTKLEIQTPNGMIKTHLNVPGQFNAANLLAAVAVVQQLHSEQCDDLHRLIERIRPVRGRMTVIQQDPFAVVVDFAHTPGSFERILPFFRSTTKGRLIVVFGSAGERDVQKRPKQGAIADQYADQIFLTDEDPRSEDRMTILEQIAAGCTRLTTVGCVSLIPDRRQAIAAALGMAQPEDCVLLLGKGHETSIIGKDGPIAWDEATVARQFLR